MKQAVKPRLLILTSSFPNGPGDETCAYVRGFARHLSFEFDVTVLAPADRRAEATCGEPYKLVRAPSFVPGRLNPFQATADLNGLRGAGIAVKLAALMALIGFLARALGLARKADVICSHWLLPSGLVGALLSRLSGKPHVAIEHSGALHLLASMRGGRRLARFIVAASRHVAVVSEDLRRKLIVMCPEAADKSSVIPMGVEVNRSDVAQAAGLRGSLPSVRDLAQAAGLRRILFIGRLTAIKGADVLLAALNGEPRVRLLVAGDGPERRRLEQLAAAFSIDAEFLGRVDAATRDALLASCDAVVIPSRRLENQRTEGSPVVCLEAMAAGCAVVAARTGGLAEIIRDPHNGLLFEPDDARMLAEKLRLLLADAALRARLGGQARRTAAAYAWPRVAGRYGRLIKDSLKDHATDNDTNAGVRHAAR